MKWALHFLLAICVLHIASNTSAFPKTPMNIKWEYIDIDEENRIVTLKCIVTALEYTGKTGIELSMSPGIELLEGDVKKEIQIEEKEPYAFLVKFRVPSQGDYFIRAVARSMEVIEKAPKGIKGVHTVTVNLDGERIILDGVSNYYDGYEPIDFSSRVGKKENEEQKLTPEDQEKLDRTRTKKGTARKYLSDEGKERLKIINKTKEEPVAKELMGAVEIEEPRNVLKGTATGKNLVPYKPYNWDYPIVPSSVPGTNTVGPDLTGGVTTYIDMAVANIGTDDITETFYVDLYLDDAYIGYFYCDTLLSNFYTYYLDDPYIIDEGYHTLKIIADSRNNVVESDETDNEYERQFYWNPPPKPDLTCYKPGGWQLSIIPSSEPGTHTVGPDLESGYKTYIDWAIRNEGSADITITFYVNLTLDGDIIETWTVNGLNVYQVHAVEDFEHFVEDGIHTLNLEIDCYDSIDEEDEYNNECPDDFFWERTPQLTVEGYFDFDNKIEPFNVTIKNAKVELWDDDSDGNDDLLVSGYTNGSGKYFLGPVNNVDEDEGDSYQDFYVRVYADGEAAKVIDSSEDTWSFNTETYNEASAEYYFEGYCSAPTEYDDAAFNIYDVVRTGHGWVGQMLPLQTPNQVTMIWFPGNPQETGFDPVSKDISILGKSGGAGPDQWDNGVILHEYGHFIGDWQGIMKPGGGGGHTWHSEIDEFMAWAEGWAHYFSIGTRDAPTIVRTGTEIVHTVNAEDGTEVVDFVDPELEDEYYYANDLGEDCEGSVAGILWDIYDAIQDDQNEDGIGDELNELHDAIWIIIDMYETGFPSHGIYSILEFWDAWVAYGYSPIGQLWATYFEHGIDRDDNPPSVTLISPNGGEVLYEGAQFLIEWSASDATSGVDRIDILLSTNGGADYPYLEIEGTGNDGQELWTVPGTLSSECKIKVVAHDRSGISAEDESDGVFEIKKPIAVVVPNGGETCAIGCDLMIEWSVLDESVSIDQFDISYSHDGGSWYDPITSCGGGLREVLWENVPGPPSGECLVKVVAWATGGGSYTDISDGFFATYDPITEWNLPCEGVPVCATAEPQGQSHITYDGYGGTIISWVDLRNGNTDIYAQKADADGNFLWTADGVAICTANDEQSYTQSVADGSGGAILTWQDYRDEDNIGLYAQRVDAGGVVQWTPDGIAIYSTCLFSMFDRLYPKIISDMAGGAIIVWWYNNNSFPTQYGIFAQRVDPDGDILWEEGGVSIFDFPCPSGMPIGVDIISDGAGGAFIVWSDDGCDDQVIYAQRINSKGEKYWPYSIPGVAICEATGIQWDPNITSDGSGGIIIVWQDHRNFPCCVVTDIYAQRIDADGAVQWSVDGVAIGREISWPDRLQLIPDGAGGAIVAWRDCLGGITDYCDIYAQRVDANGMIQWIEDGIPVCTAPGGQFFPKLAPDGPDGAIITWQDERGEFPDIYAQRVDVTGEVQWRADGEAVCSADGRQDHPLIIEGAVAVWTDHRNGNEDVYAQKIEGTAPAPVPDCVISYKYYFPELEQYYLPSEHLLFGCPAGDGWALVVGVDFDDEDMTRDIGAGEVTLDKPETPVRFWNEGLITADSAAAGEYGYVTTITQPYISGCSECSGCEVYDIPVRLNGIVIGMVDADTLVVKSPDYTKDGFVDLSDFSHLGDTYNKGEGEEGYNTCFDFTGDGGVDLSDFSLFAEHYNHYYPPLFPMSTLARSSARSSAGVRLGVQRAMGDGWQDKLCVTLYLENAGRITAVGLGLDKGNPSLEYKGWVPNPGFRVTAIATSAAGHDRELVIIGLLGMESPGDSEVEVGTLEFEIKGDDEIDVGEGLFSLAFGEVMDVNGNVLRMQGVECEEETPVYRNGLANNYPNPFNPLTTIEYSIAGDSPVNLSIYNVNGQLVRTLVDGFRAGNSYRVTWDGRDNSGKPVASGVYFYRIVTNSFRKSKKLIILR